MDNQADNLFKYGEVVFKPSINNEQSVLITDYSENEYIEFKRTGNIFFSNNDEFKNKIKKTIVSFLNKDGGSIFLGVDDKNHVLIGGEYDAVDKDKLSNWISNLIKELNISGLNLIDYKFYSIPYEYQIPATNNIKERVLPVIEVKKAPFTIYYKNHVYIRELSSITKITVEQWEKLQVIKAKKERIRIFRNALITKEL
jgi:predicted HTH transcriptional regulator